MEQLPTDNLQQAIKNAVAELRREFPELTDRDVHDAYAEYRRHFAERQDDPPVSTFPARDELLLTIWDVIVDRETEGLDMPDQPLEDYYVVAFDGLLDAGSETERVSPPLAVGGEPVESPLTPPPPADREADSAAANAIEDEITEPVDTILKIRIALDGSQPEVNRTILVDRFLSQTQLHHIIQAAMGWRGTEDFQFFPSVNQDLPSSGEVQAGDLFAGVQEHCGYEFDGWYHDLQLLSRERPEGRRFYPVCIAGERACPPEDIGGVAEYNEMLAVLDDPEHPDYREMAGWLTQDFHPDAFNIEQANLRLSRYQTDDFKAVV